MQTVFRARQQRDHSPPHQARDARLAQIRGKYRFSLTPEQISRTAFHQHTGSVKHQRLVGARLVKMRADQHLLQAVQMLQPRQQRIARQRHRAERKRNALLAPLQIVRRVAAAGNNARRFSHPVGL